MGSMDKGPQGSLGKPRTRSSLLFTFHLYDVSEYASHWGVSMTTMEELSTMCFELPRNQALSQHKGLV